MAPRRLLFILLHPQREPQSSILPSAWSSTLDSSLPQPTLFDSAVAALDLVSSPFASSLKSLNMVGLAKVEDRPTPPQGEFIELLSRLSS